MKKILAIAVVLMMVPLSAYALEMLTEDVMDDVTGQAGVSIAVDDVKIFQQISSLRYEDTDGLTNPLAVPGTPTGAAASIGIADLNMMVHINAILFDTTNLTIYSPGRALQGDYTVTQPDGTPFNYNNTAGDTVFVPSPLTIDVTEELPILSEALAYKSGVLSNIPGTTTPGSLNVAGVMIGLPTVEIHQSALSFDITVEATDAINGLPGGGTGYADNSYGRIHIGNQTIAILDGFLEIAPH